MSANTCNKCDDMNCPRSSGGAWANDVEALLADVVCALNRIAKTLARARRDDGD